MVKNHQFDGFKLNYPVFLSAAIVSLIIGVIMIVVPDKTAESLGSIELDFRCARLVLCTIDRSLFDVCALVSTF